MTNLTIDGAESHFKEVLTEQLERIQRLQQATPTVNYSKKHALPLGFVGATALVKKFRIKHNVFLSIA